MNENNNFQNGGGSTLQSLIEGFKRYVDLQIDYARLTVTEKLTIVLSTMALYALIIIFSALAVVFITLGVGHLLATTIAPHFAYLIVSGFYIILIVLAYVFRKRLFINPISRFISKLFVEPPKKNRNEKEKTEG